MKDFYGSSAVINTELLLKNADETLYLFIGQDMYAPITTSMHPEDAHKFGIAIQELQTKDMPKNMVLVRMKSRKGEYFWSIVELTALPPAADDEPLFRIVFHEPAASSANELSLINQEYEDLFGLLEGILLAYEPEEEYLEIFKRENGQRIYWFQGNLQEWQESLKGKIESAYVGELETLCNELRQSKKTIQRSIVARGLLGESNELAPYVIKGQLVHNVAGKSRILGSVSCGHRDREELLGLEGDRDAGLPVLNKKAIIEYAKRIMVPGNGKVCLVIVDLDDFKTINDTFGHLFGDQVLNKTVEVLKEALGTRGVVGRIGGDELMLVFNRVESDAEIRNMLRTIRTNVEWSYRGQREDLRVTCSLGAAVYPEHGASYEQIFEIADKMLYIAKKKGKNRYVIYVPEIHDQDKQQEKFILDNPLKHFRADKAGVMQRFIEKFLVKKTVTYETAITEIGYCFDLEEIILVQGNLLTVTVWNREGLFQDPNEKELTCPEESFWKSFDQDNLLIMNNIFNLEGKSRILTERLQQKGIQSALFYRFSSREKTAAGYIMFAKKKRRQMWSEEDTVLLGLVGKVMELSAV